jgi:hypothetical protein
MIRTRKMTTPSHVSKILSFLNSPFGVAVFSSIVVSGAGFAVTKYIDYRDQETLRRTRILRINMEIGMRFEKTAVEIEFFKQRFGSIIQTDANGHWHVTKLDPQTSQYVHEHLSSLGVERLSAPPDGSGTSFFPEFSHQTLESLLMELDLFSGITDRKSQHLFGMAAESLNGAILAYQSQMVDADKFCMTGWYLEQSRVAWMAAIAPNLVAAPKGAEENAGIVDGGSSLPPR